VSSSRLWKSIHISLDVKATVICVEFITFTCWKHTIWRMLFLKMIFNEEIQCWGSFEKKGIVSNVNIKNIVKVKTQWYKTTAISSMSPSIYIPLMLIILTITMKERTPIGTSPLTCWRSNEVIFPRYDPCTDPRVMALPTIWLIWCRKVNEAWALSSCSE
jgi:hypothetical protein